MTSRDPGSSHTPDREGERIERGLTQLFATPVPAGLADRIDGWLADAERAGPPAASRRRLMRVVPIGVARVAAVLALVVLVVGTAAAATGLIDWREAWRVGFGTERLSDTDGLDVEINQSQSVDGYTVTIGRAYADPFQFVFQSRIEVAEGVERSSTRLGETQVYDESGLFLGGQPAIVTNEEGVTINQYYANPLPPDRDEVTYRIVFEDIPSTVYSAGGTPGVPDPPGQPLTFTVTVPLGPGLSAVPGEQVASNGTPAEVTSLTTGRLGTRMSMTNVGFRADVTIEVDGESYRLTNFMGGVACPLPADRPITFQASEAIPLDRGPWTVRVVARPDQAPPTGGEYGPDPCYQFTPDGEWTFTVDPARSMVGGG